MRLQNPNLPLYKEKTFTDVFKLSNCHNDASLILQASESYRFMKMSEWNYHTDTYLSLVRLKRLMGRKGKKALNDNH